jgi:ketosteroid isomerase-like protein
METQEMTMTTQAVASRLAELCKQGKFDEAQNELFAEDALSIEAYATPDFPKETKGLDAIREKAEKWNSMVTKMNSLKVSDPLLAGNSFALTIRMDVEMKNGQKVDMTELCVYTVKDGKVTSEQFFM